MKPFPQPSWIALALLAAATAPADAGEFPLFGGSVQGVWKSQVTVGAGIGRASCRERVSLTV